MLHIELIGEDFSLDQFNTKALHPLQSWQWGEARKKMGIEVIRIGEFGDNHTLQNVYQMTLHSIPYTRFIVGYLPRSVIPSKEVLVFLHNFGKKRKVIFIKIEPYARKSQNLKPKSQLNSKQFEMYQSPHPLFPNWTLVLDLTKTEEELLTSMKQKTRYNIRLAQRKGVYVKEESNEKGFEIFSRLFFETCKRQKYFSHNRTYHRIVWETLKNYITHILIAYYKAEPLAAYELFHFKNTLYYPYGGSSLNFRNFMAPNLLMWEAICLGKRLGATTFDMWGSLPPNYSPEHPWSGFTKFKEGYGAEFVEMVGSYDLVVDAFLYKVYNLLYKGRYFILNF